MDFHRSGSETNVMSLAMTPSTAGRPPATDQGETTVPTRRIHLALGAVACIAALTASGPAASQVPGRPGASATAAASSTASPGDRADEMYRKGIAAGAAKDWPRAFQFLWEAYQLKKSYDIEGNLGTAELRLGKYQAAAEHLAHSLTLFPVNGSPDAKAKTEGLLEEAKKEVGILRLTVTPPGAMVKVGDRQLGPEDSRDQVFVVPGEMRVEAGGVNEFEGTSQSVKVAKGQVVTVSLTLVPRAKPTASGTSSAGPAGTSVPAADPLRTPLIISGLAVTAATLGVGIGLLVGGAWKKGEADQLREDLLKSGKTVCGAGSTNADCVKFTDAAGSYATLTNAGGGAMIAGGLVGIATVIYTVVSRPRADVAGAPPRVTVSVGPGGAALGIRGSF